MSIFGKFEPFSPPAPISLVVFSAGGLIAFEMAQQLSMEGQKVALLILFDPSEPETANFKVLCSSGRYSTNLEVLFSFMSRHWNNLQHLNFQEKCKHLLERI